jgi:hypothetical protein
MNVTVLKMERLERAKSSMAGATAKYKIAESEWHIARREYEQSWKDFIRDLERFDVLDNK